MGWGFWLASPFHQKARKGIIGRQHWKKELAKIKSHFLAGKEVVWMHCASLGEFEQGLPVLESLKAQQPELAVLVSFFSPSGYEARKNHPVADAVVYLPLDTPANARYFISQVNPRLTLFVKYEFWGNVLREAKQHGSKLVLFAANFHKKQPFFKPYGGYYRATLDQFDVILTQNQASAELAKTITKSMVIVGGDPRYDRCFQRMQEIKPNARIAAFKGNKKLLVVGSSWQEEEALLRELLPFAGWKCLVVPHEPARAASIRKMLPKAYLWSENAPDEKDADLLVLDTMGHLFGAYALSDLTLVGGGFSNALHNTIEPAVMGNALAFGPRHGKYPEADEFIRVNAAKEVYSTADLKALMFATEALKAMGEHALNYCRSQLGATEKIVSAIIR